MTTALETPSVTVRFDYSGAEALLFALEKPSLSDADVARLLENRSLRTMIAHQSHYVPSNDRTRFERDIRAFARSHKDPGGAFGFGEVYQARMQVQSLIARLKASDQEIVRAMVAQLEPYRPRTGPLAATIYFVVGGNSDGFVPDGEDEPAFFVALDKASGDQAGIQQNMTHELYHVMQKAAMRRIPALATIARDPSRASPPERLLLTTLWEGTANYAADALKAEGTGPYMEMWRSRYRRNAAPARIAENFALFDAVLADLRSGHRAWDEAYSIGCSGNNDARLYFVGYEIAKAIELYLGSVRIRELFEQAPAIFFQVYIALCREHREISSRFTQATESYIETLR